MSDTRITAKQEATGTEEDNPHNAKRHRLNDTKEAAASERAATTVSEVSAYDPRSSSVGSEDGDMGPATSANSPNGSAHHSGKQKEDGVLDRLTSIAKAIFGLSELRGACTPSPQEFLRSPDDETMNGAHRSRPRTLVDDIDSGEESDDLDPESLLREAINTVQAIDH